MKKLIALLLVLCTVFGLVACGKKPAETPNGTTPSTSVEDGGDGPMTPDKSPYNGKTVEIWGQGTDESYNHDNWDGKGNYIWMMRAAIVEWAAQNGVTIKWCGSYNQNAMLAAMNSGENPDIVFHTNQYPAIANNGITAAFTEAEYNKIAEITGKSWLDMLTYGTKKVGIVLPWTGTMMCYYNKTMFEDYGVKTPKEYFDEGKWTWETFLKCMEETTKDVDSDNTMDTYGLPGDSWGNVVNPWAQNEKGELISVIDEPWMQDFFQLKYDAFAVKKCSVSAKNQIQKNVTYPMFAMQLSDCEPYNFEHMFQEIANGNELEVVPVPDWVGKDGQKLSTSKVTQACVSLAASCDERDAATDCLAYLMKCGLKYISDFSLGDVKCDYPGVLGTCDYSKTWKENFAKVCQKRAADYKEITDAKDYASAHIAKVNEYLDGRDKYIYGTYTKVTILTGFSEITQMPPASSIPAIKQKYQNMLDVYNSTYINK